MKENTAFTEGRPVGMSPCWCDYLRHNLYVYCEYITIFAATEKLGNNEDMKQ